jgi:hypothetical protein
MAASSVYVHTSEVQKLYVVCYTENILQLSKLIKVNGQIFAAVNEQQ